jgi:signal transduction histidine kinase
VSSVDRAEVRPGDRIGIGGYEFTLLMDAPGPAASEGDETRAAVISSVIYRKALIGDTAADDTDREAGIKAKLTVLQELAEVACGVPEIDQLLLRILDKLPEVFPQAASAHAVLLGMGEQGEDLYLSSGESGPSGPGRISSTLMELTTRDHKAVRAVDAAADMRLRQAESIVGQGLRSIICSPLIVHGKALGAIQVSTRSGSPPFGEEDLQLLAIIAGQAAAAAEGARLNRELVAQHRLAAIGETISSLAHCIKNVLNGLSGGAYILDVGIRNEDSEQTSKGWSMVKRNTDFMHDLAKDMLAYCRKQALVPEMSDLKELLESSVLMLQETASRQGVEVSSSIDESLRETMIDATAMKRVVINLLTNAVEACGRGKRVKLTAAPNDVGDTVTIKVEDQGRGIESQDRDKLFTPFFTTKGGRGTGLGLALVKKVVEEHGGTIEFESEPGKGTCFQVSIPQSHCTESTPASGEANAASGA